MRGDRVFDCDDRLVRGASGAELLDPRVQLGELLARALVGSELRGELGKLVESRSKLRKTVTGDVVGGARRGELVDPAGQPLERGKPVGDVGRRRRQTLDPAVELVDATLCYLEGSKRVSGVGRRRRQTLDPAVELLDAALCRLERVEPGAVVGRKRLDPVTKLVELVGRLTGGVESCDDLVEPALKRDELSACLFVGPLRRRAGRSAP